MAIPRTSATVPRTPWGGKQSLDDDFADEEITTDLLPEWRVLPKTLSIIKYLQKKYMVANKWVYLNKQLLFLWAAFVHPIALLTS